jgi:hypothetical protein
VAFDVFDSSLDARLRGIDLPAEVRQSIDSQRDRLAGIELPQGLSKETTTLARTTIGAAYVDAFRANMLIAAALAAASAVSAFLFVEGNASRKRQLESSPVVADGG